MALEQAGAFAVVLECVPAPLASAIAKETSIPIIGIGAGQGVDAQVLVFHDLVGLSGDFQPRFVRRYANVETTMIEAVKSFQSDVEAGRFPDDSESFLASREDEQGDVDPESERQLSG